MSLDPVDNFNVIPISVAAVLTENWQKENVLKAFLFHKNDIECLAQEEGVIGVRFYIGITKKENGEDAPDMIAVGVNDLNEDIIYDTSESDTIDDFSGIYDFALPCPKLCDPDSDLFSGGSDVMRSSTSRTIKTVKHSTEDECFINLGEISEQDAIDRVSVWQCDMEKSLISVYFNMEDLDAIFREFPTANALRVYFGIERNVHRVILIGAKNSEEDKAYYQDIDTGFVYANTTAPCTGNGEATCAIDSPLYKPCD